MLPSPGYIADTRKALVKAAIGAFDMCGSMRQAIKDEAADLGLTLSDDTIGQVIIEANEQIRSSVRR